MTMTYFKNSRLLLAASLVATVTMVSAAGAQDVVEQMPAQAAMIAEKAQLL